MTREEREYLDKITSMGCIVCLRLGHGYTPAEVHHPRSLGSMGKKAPHTSAIALCWLHHRGGVYGISYHSGAKAFAANFGHESDLLAETLRRLQQSHDILA